MEAYNYLKEIYSGKRAIYNHITLFSLLGIMVIFLNNLSASWGSSLYIDIFAIPPSSSFELWVALFGGFFTALYLFGYGYQYVNSLFKRDDRSLLEFTFQPFGTFFRVFPMFFLWQNYITLFAVFGTLIILAFNNLVILYVFGAIITMFLPFVHMVLITFSARFKYRVRFFYPWIVLQYFDKTFSDVVCLFLQVLLLALVPIAIITTLVITSMQIEHEVYQYAIELASLCFGVYSFAVLKLVFSAGLVRIIKEKIMP